MYRELRQVKRKEHSKAEVKIKWGGEMGLKRSYPRTWPKIEPDLAEKMIENCHQMTCEVGCGPGRIAKLFNPAEYIGIDINNISIQKAKKLLPGHTFKTIKWEDPYPLADTYLFLTVLFHIPDNEIHSIIEKLNHKVIIIETMARWIRDYDRDFNFRRDPEEYRNIFKEHGFKEQKLIQFSSTVYPYYINMQVLNK